ncbi:MAG: sugar phosphate isomerase/epimerase [Planctomycetota bacterium]|nr:sugar phosphate isomerase/epimerase [Planctomycetota bacterium]
MPKPIALQLYTLREKAKEGFPQVLKTVAEIGYVGVELAGLYGHPAKDVKKMCGDLGLTVCSTHSPIFDPAQTDAVVEQANLFGYRYVVGGFGADQFASPATIQEAAAKVNDAVERFSKRGLKVGIHNHWWEYDAPNKGDLLLELCPGAFPQLDIYWIQTGGADPVKYIQKYADRAYLLHVKDGPCEQKLAMTAVGKGKVNIKGSLEAAEKAATEWYIVEIDRTDGDMVQAVRDSYTYLIKNGLARGNK